MQFRLLGPVAFEIGGEALPVSRRRERCLLGILLLELGRAVPAGRLAELLWDGAPPDRARRAIHSHISRLRTAVGSTNSNPDAAIVTVGDGYRIQVDPQTVDVHRFRTLLDRAAGTSGPADRIELLRTALDLWRGRPLEDVASDWLRDRICGDLAERRLQAIEDLMAASLALRREREVMPELAQIAASHPARESLAGLHMQALYQAGRKVDALEVYVRTRAHLADELGLDPGPALRELHQRILRDELAVPAAASGASAAPLAAPVLPAPPATVPRQLPVDVSSFTGRGRYLDQLDALLPEAGRQPTSVVIAAIAGTAGVGKTALAIHWACRVSHRFPDGQLYVNLRGFDPHVAPVEPATALRGFLDALQVPPQRIPSDLDAQTGLYRSLLAGRRMLILLDNARDAGQVRPLLTGAPGTLVLVTSRDRLAGLVATDDAIPFSLDLLPDHEARQLLAARLGHDRLDAEPTAVADLLAACAGLPLALAVVAARAATQPGTLLAGLAAEVREAGAGLGPPWTGPDPATDLRAVFSWSYQALDPQAARLFRLLGLHPGPDLATTAAASLAGEPTSSARALLAELTGANLLTEPTAGRYTFHDLLRAYAAELAHTVDSDADRHAAWHRLLDHYLHAADAARNLHDPHRRTPYQLTPPRSGVVLADLPDHERAAGWFRTELPVLLQVIEHATAIGFHAHTWQLAHCLANFLSRHGYRHHRLTIHRTALLAAQLQPDQTGQALAHTGLGRAFTAMGDYDQAREHFERALALHRELADLTGQAYSHFNLSYLGLQQQRYDQALRQAQCAYDAFRDAGDQAGQGRALNTAGWVCALVGDYRQALTLCEQALAIQQQVGDTSEAGSTWDSLGYIHHHLGDYQLAVECYRHALALYDRNESRHNRADTLAHLGDTFHATGQANAARQAWQAARDLFRELDHPDADRLNAQLEKLAESGPRLWVGHPNGAPPLP